MAIPLEKISSTVHSYLEAHPGESASLEPLLDALAKGFDFTSRRRFPAHITAGVVLINPRQQVLQVHHRRLGRWLHPGGHCEPADKSLPGTALRELAEECGVRPEDIEPIGGEDALPVQIDVHAIPAAGSRGEPAHRHFDFRFAYRAPVDLQVTVGTEAVSHRWKPLLELGDSVLAARLG